MKICVNSEIGKLQGVILHRPGKEIERMTPENIHTALYNDILSEKIAKEEYSMFEGVLKRNTEVFYANELLVSILNNLEIKNQIVNDVCKMHNVQLQDELKSMSAERLSEVLIEGYEIKEEFSDKRYPVPPLYNFYFTRDASVSVHNSVLINHMRFEVRERESYLMEQIFKHALKADTFHTGNSSDSHIEGGDVLIARENILLIGNGERTSKKAIEQIIKKYKSEGKKQYIVIQELPKYPASFIHLDMIFNFLDTNACMCYYPLICKDTKYHTTIVTIDGGKVSYTEKPTLISALKELNFDMEAICCGDPSDPWKQQREQWHSGANFFAIAPGKVMGYSRNLYTMEQLSKHGFEIIGAEEIINGSKNAENFKRCVIGIGGSELPRGGGGARCMTMPINRAKVVW